MVLQLARDYRSSLHQVWGASARNREQNFALNALMDPEIDFVTLLGTAGTGKTLLALAAGLAQNLTPKQMKTLLTRAGPNTKMVCLGNVEQIDTPYLTETTSGLTYAVDRFKEWPHSAHVTLRRGERSRLADFASAVL